MRGGEWIDAGMFAVIAATLIRSFFIEAYQIPTPSMERSLLVGDFLFVSKANYGARVPMTPISFPFVHHTIPVINAKAYSEALKLPYYRLPGFQKIKRNDVVVFNYPAEDLKRPVDKKENYIKRCLAIPGDTFKMKDGAVYVNGQLEENPPEAMTSYRITTTKGISQSQLRSIGVYSHVLRGNVSGGIFEANLTKKQFEEISKWGIIKDITPVVGLHAMEEAGVFPYGPNLGWNRDNYGPLYCPKAGEEITLDSFNYFIYHRAITEYEDNPEFRMLNGKFYNGQEEITSYTFKYNYYFMIGDNRHMSADSRYWGFVPENHIVGKALFIWMSLGEGKNFFDRIRWDRIFNGIH